MVGILHGLSQEAGRMPRIALCISGHFRDFEVAWPSLKKHVIDVYDPDVFAHAWNDSFGHFMHAKDKHHPSFDLGYDPSSKQVPSNYANSVAARLQPKAFKLQDPTTIKQLVDQLAEANKPFESSWEWHRPRPKYQMIYGKTQAIKLKRQYEQLHGFKYDRVIYTRWDIVHEAALPSWAVADYRLLIPSRYSYVGPADIWASGSSEQLDIYGDMLDQLPDVRQTPDFCTDPHLWLNSHLIYNRVDFVLCDVPVMIANRIF